MLRTGSQVAVPIPRSSSDGVSRSSPSTQTLDWEAWMTRGLRVRQEVSFSSVVVSRHCATPGAASSIEPSRSSASG